MFEKEHCTCDGTIENMCAYCMWYHCDGELCNCGYNAQFPSVRICFSCLVERDREMNKKLEITLRGHYFVAMGRPVEVIHIGENLIYGLLDSAIVGSKERRGYFWNKYGEYELDPDLNIQWQKCGCCDTMLPLDHDDGICTPCWTRFEDANLYPRDPYDTEEYWDTHE
jgi:hypothetical protein